MKSLILYIASFIFGGIGAWLILRWGSAIDFVDRANHRSSHDGVVPKGGGVGILGAFLLASWVLELPPLFWIPIVLTAFFSFYGDRKEISAKLRLCVQFAAGVTLLVGIFHWEGRGWPVYLIIPFFAVFVVGTANFYNFMDGIDGIAGITGIVAFGMLALFGGLLGENQLPLILAGCMGFACLGFLPFNMPNARVFMGDVGSILLGFVYAGLVVGLSYNLNDFVVLCAFLFPFYADELTTEYVRLRDGENLLTPHRRHLYQLLANDMGVAHWKVSVGYGVFQLIVGMSVISIKDYGILIVISILVLYFSAFVVAGYYIRSAVAAGFRSPDYTS